MGIRVSLASRGLRVGRKLGRLGGSVVLLVIGWRRGMRASAASRRLAMVNRLRKRWSWDAEINRVNLIDFQRAKATGA